MSEPIVGFCIVEHPHCASVYGLVQVLGDWQLIAVPQFFDHATVGGMLFEFRRDGWDMECFDGIWLCIPDTDIGESAFDLYRGLVATGKQAVAMRGAN